MEVIVQYYPSWDETRATIKSGYLPGIDQRVIIDGVEWEVVWRGARGEGNGKYTEVIRVDVPDPPAAVIERLEA